MIVLKLTDVSHTKLLCGLHDEIHLDKKILYIKSVCLGQNNHMLKVFIFIINKVIPDYPG